MLISDVFPDQEIEELFCQLRSVNAVVLAVSGGADSLAMMYLFAHWRDKSGWPGNSIVATVDHKLRPEAAEEAEFVAKISARLGFRHEILEWNEFKPVSNIQAHAREARYKLLRELCKSNSVSHILLAHHADDQAETIISRLIRGSGVTGLAAMRPVSEINGIHLVRPLLSVFRSDLEKYLEDQDTPWISDPGNSNAKYQRVRIRQFLSSENLDTSRLLGTAKRMQRAEDALNAYLDRFVSSHVTIRYGSIFQIELEPYFLTPCEIRMRVLVFLINRLAGSDYKPREKSVTALELKIQDGPENAAQVTLGGVVFRWSATRLYCWREIGRASLLHQTISPGQILDYDNRISLSLSADSKKEYLLRPIGAVLPGFSGMELDKKIPRAAVHSIPGVWDKQQLLHLLIPETVLELQYLGFFDISFNPVLQN